MTPEAEEADGRRLAGGGQAGARPPRVPPDHGGQPDEARGQVSHWSQTWTGGKDVNFIKVNGQILV